MLVNTFPLVKLAPEILYKLQKNVTRFLRNHLVQLIKDGKTFPDIDELINLIQEASKITGLPHEPIQILGSQPKITRHCETDIDEKTRAENICVIQVGNPENVDTSDHQPQLNGATIVEPPNENLATFQCENKVANSANMVELRPSSSSEDEGKSCSTSERAHTPKSVELRTDFLNVADALKVLTELLHSQSNPTALLLAAKKFVAANSTGTLGLQSAEPADAPTPCHCTCHLPGDASNPPKQAPAPNLAPPPPPPPAPPVNLLNGANGAKGPGAKKLSFAEQLAVNANKITSGENISNTNGHSSRDSFNKRGASKSHQNGASDFIHLDTVAQQNGAATSQNGLNPCSDDILPGNDPFYHFSPAQGLNNLLNKLFPVVPLPSFPQPKTRLKAFQWNQLPIHKIRSVGGGDNLWCKSARRHCATSQSTSQVETPPTLVDFGKLEELFCINETPNMSHLDVHFGSLDRAASTSALNSVESFDGEPTYAIRGRRERAVHLLDAKRSLNASIFLKQFRRGVDDLLSIITSCSENDELSAEQLRGLLKVLPDSDELERLNAYTGQIEKLGAAEQFFLRLVQISELVMVDSDLPKYVTPFMNPFVKIDCIKVLEDSFNYKLRIELMLYRAELSATLEQVRPACKTLCDAAKAVRKSSALQEILYLVLTVGNYLNASSTSSVPAAGFRLSSLWKLVDIRANKHDITLLHFVAMQVQEKYPSLLCLSDELKTVEAAAKISLESIKIDVQSLKEKIHRLSAQISNQRNVEQYLDDARRFIQFARTELADLDSDLSQLDTWRSALAQYFCEEPLAAFRLDECFTVLHAFRLRLEKAMKENVERAERLRRAEERRRWFDTAHPVEFNGTSTLGRHQNNSLSARGSRRSLACHNPSNTVDNENLNFENGAKNESKSRHSIAANSSTSLLDVLCGNNGVNCDSRVLPGESMVSWWDYPRVGTYTLLKAGGVRRSARKKSTAAALEAGITDRERRARPIGGKSHHSVDVSDIGSHHRDDHFPSTSNLLTFGRDQNGAGPNALDQNSTADVSEHNLNRWRARSLHGLHHTASASAIGTVAPPQDLDTLLDTLQSEQRQRNFPSRRRTSAHNSPIPNRKLSENRQVITGSVAETVAFLENSQQFTLAENDSNFETENEFEAILETCERNQCEIETLKGQNVVSNGTKCHAVLPSTSPSTISPRSTEHSENERKECISDADTKSHISDTGDIPNGNMAKNRTVGNVPAKVERGKNESSENQGVPKAKKSNGTVPTGHSTQKGTVPSSKTAGQKSTSPLSKSSSNSSRSNLAPVQKSSTTINVMDKSTAPSYMRSTSASKSLRQKSPEKVPTENRVAMARNRKISPTDSVKNVRKSMVGSNANLAAKMGAKDKNGGVKSAFSAPKLPAQRVKDKEGTGSENSTSHRGNIKASKGSTAEKSTPNNAGKSAERSGQRRANIAPMHSSPARMHGAAENAPIKVAQVKRHSAHVTQSKVANCDSNRVTPKDGVKPAKSVNAKTFERLYSPPKGATRHSKNLPPNHPAPRPLGTWPKIHQVQVQLHPGAPAQTASEKLLKIVPPAGRKKLPLFGDDEMFYFN